MEPFGPELDSSRRLRRGERLRSTPVLLFLNRHFRSDHRSELPSGTFASLGINVRTAFRPESPPERSDRSPFAPRLPHLVNASYRIIVPGSLPLAWLAVPSTSRRPSGLRKTTITLNSLAHRTTWLRSDFRLQTRKPARAFGPISLRSPIAASCERQLSDHRSGLATSRLARCSVNKSEAKRS